MGYGAHRRKVSRQLALERAQHNIHVWRHLKRLVERFSTLGQYEACSVPCAMLPNQLLELDSCLHTARSTQWTVSRQLVDAEAFIFKCVGCQSGSSWPAAGYHLRIACPSVIRAMHGSRSPFAGRAIMRGSQ